MSQVQKGNEMIAALTGETPTLFRCPYGEYNDQIITTVRAMGMTPVQWDVDALE
jgi:peptidoglycan/xylan/chitin deacetylase (PgdA/CDA1 family)